MTTLKDANVLADVGGSVALVTGANKGIGKEIARGLARRGMVVMLGARDVDRGMEAAGELSADGHVEPVCLDVTDEESVRAAIETIARRHGRLDALVNNAGTNVGYQKPSEVGAAEFRQVYETNVFGPVTVTNAALPLLRGGQAGRIVNVSSMRGSIAADGAWVAQPSMPYSTSKTALNAITAHYANHLRDTPIKVNAASPGHVATDFNHYAGHLTPEVGAQIFVTLATLGPDGPTGAFFDYTGDPLPW
ncbi:SDR family oxidoreductase [Tsukamurella sp. 8F]|uniref:SDR family oxidoreductase n=1 Tax=unclassified Tsukamurella TaxID=2633480 RepID=UPI0023B90761|nr:MULTISPECIES: SDR family oxidoreductase [unclassified Tsukamurella]MDF0528807.1 SDR family oxidoreductase [Tsukamurella sp. 8J]MDF0586642.1 SDR family oxidoreductase [Tsukamurella sp. 8F]